MILILPELSGRQEVVGPLLDVLNADVEPGRDDTALVQPSGEADDDLSTSVVVDDLELADVAVLHHHGQEAGQHLRRGAEQDLETKQLSWEESVLREMANEKISI